MRKKFSKIAMLLVSVLLISFLPETTAFAEGHNDTYSYDRWEEAVPSQAGYLAVRSVSGKDLGTDDFSEPSDIFLDAHDRFFIADSQNNRIVVTNSDLTETVMIMSEFHDENGSLTTLNQPEGVYVSPETDLIYIADYGNSRVLVCDDNSNILLEITRPESELFPQELTFMPKKILADKAGNIYVVLGNITTGAAMFSPDGEFLGYYGANTVETTSAVMAEYFWKLISTEEMRSRTLRTVPSGITSFDLDNEGFIYTCTQSTTQKKDMVKKLDPAGKNLFASLNISWGDVESVYDASTNQYYQSMLCDIDISDNGNINCLELTSGRIFQYDEDGNLLFIFGNISEQLGGFREVTAIESMGNKILVLDSRKNTITVFAETDFGRIVHEAIELYNNGYYKQALEPWYQVLQYDGNYHLAFVGISAALLAEGDYAGSMKYAELADSSYRYNKAFEGYRAEWLAAHIHSVVIAVILSTIAIMLIRIYFRKHRKFNPENKKIIPLIKLTDMQWISYTVTHPIEGFADMRWKKAGSVRYAVMIILFWFAASVFYHRLYGFQFYTETDKYFNIIPYILQTIILFLIWVAGNWSVCTLLDGEGKMKNIFIYSAYALIPYVTSIYIEVFLSHFLIRDEIIFIEAVRIIGMLWSSLLVFSAMKSVHQYSFSRTIKAIFLTICAMLIMLFLLILLLSLFQQICIFICSIYTEIAYRLKV